MMKQALVLAALLFASGAQASVPDPLEPPELVTVVLTKGDTLVARSIEPRPFEMFRITDLAGEERNLPANRILRVIDTTGADRTRDALERRQTIGSPPTVVEVRLRKPRRYARTSRSYGLSDLTVLGRRNPSPATSYDRSSAITFELGRARNVGDHLSLGLSVFATTGGAKQYADIGIRPRIRRWLGKRSSVEWGPGIILAHAEPVGWRPHGPGFVGQVALNYSEWLGLAVQGYTVRRSGGRRYFHDQITGFERIERDSGVMIGVRIGGTPGLVTGTAASLLGLFAMGMHGSEVYAPAVP